MKMGVSENTDTCGDAILAKDASRTLEGVSESLPSAFTRLFALELLPACPRTGDELGRWHTGASG